jgi:RNase H
VAKRDWEKAKRRDAVPPKPRDSGQSGAKRQAALAAFVSQHDLRCFKCGAEKAEWAKTGVGKRGPWAICASCVSIGAEARRGPSADRPLPADLKPARSTTGPIVYTDGACSRNPGRGGFAAVIVGLLPSEPLVVSGGEGHTTNNRMEMRGS